MTVADEAGVSILVPPPGIWHLPSHFQVPAIEGRSRDIMFTWAGANEGKVAAKDTTPTVQRYFMVVLHHNYNLFKILLKIHVVKLHYQRDYRLWLEAVARLPPTIPSSFNLLRTLPSHGANFRACFALTRRMRRVATGRNG